MKYKPQEILGKAGPGKVQNPLAYINEYNDEMSSSQVVRFFEKQNLHITQTMIQNYVKTGLLPAPKNKRYYVKTHFILLTILLQVKDILPLDVMTEIIRPLWENHPDELEYVYVAFLRMQEDAFREASEAVPHVVDATEDEKIKFDKNGNSECLAIIALLGFLLRSIAAKRNAASVMEIIKC